jgi:two-component system, NtrC family, response regulator PilR
MSLRILIVDDEEIIRYSLAILLRREGYSVYEANNGAEALRMQEEEPFDLIISDVEMPEMKGTELLKKVLSKWPETYMIIITAFASVDTAVDALRQGAYDYIIKPLDFDDLLHRVHRIVEHKRLSAENALLKEELKKRDSD